MKVLIVDDSLLYRRILQDIVSDLPFVAAVETAGTGAEALDKAAAWSPDVITLDVDMPDMSGIRVLRELKLRDCPASVVMVSALTGEGTGVAVLATELGAVDVIAKPRSASPEAARAEVARQIHFVLRGLAMRRPGAMPLPPVSLPQARVTRNLPARRPDVVAIGASTGGPAALISFVERLPRDFGIPVVVTLHLADGFTRPFAEALDRRGGIHVAEAEDGIPLLPCTVYLSPGGRQTGIVRAPGEPVTRFTVNDSPPENGCLPSVDYLLRSVAAAFGGRAVGVILTGMGRDGVEGLRRMKAEGAYTIAQDEESCVVFGMPAAAIRAGLVDFVAAPADIVSHIVAIVQRTA